MVKRKREVLTIEKSLAKSHRDVFKAIKTAKGFERQRLSKRLREPGLTNEKKQKLDLEVKVLKSLDLEQTAAAHLSSVLNRIPVIAQHPKLPDYICHGVPKPDISEEEKAALHTVTSSLFSRPNVRQVMDNIIEETCMILDVQLPEKKRPRKRKADFEKESQAQQNPSMEPEDKKPEPPIDPEQKLTAKGKKELARKRLLEGINLDAISGDDDDSEEGEFAGFSDSEVDLEDNNAHGSNKEEAGSDLDSDAAEAAIEKMANMVGASDSEDENSASDDDTLALTPRKKAPTKTVKVRDVSVSLSESEDSEEKSDSEDEALTSKFGAKTSAKTAKSLSGKPGESAFLPSLMGGYISGSESEASDLEITPVRKNRLGQKQRQAIWEKKYGEKAKHHAKQAAAAAKKGVEWDSKRGAVWDAKKPWKNGMDPSEKKEKALKKVANALDGGSLHPSWEARRKLKEQTQKIVIGAGAPAAKKITFDD